MRFRAGSLMTQAAAGEAPEAGDQFGTALAAGDFDDDDLKDLAVGTPGETPGLDPKSGAVKLIPAAELAP